MEAASVISKEEFSAWKKWEFGSLDPLKSRKKTAQSTKQSTQSAQPAPHTAPEQTANQQAEAEMTALPTAEQIEHIYQQAREEGKRTGYQEGLEQATQTVAAEIQQLQTLANALSEEIKNVDQAVAQDLLALAVELAKKITGKALQIKPELILPLVEKAISQLPTISQPIRLTVHPDDAARIRAHLDNHPIAPKWKVLEDIHIEPGGCRVESGGCEVDATLATRWQRTLAALGHDQNWLE